MKALGQNSPGPVFSIMETTFHLKNVNIENYTLITSSVLCWKKTIMQLFWIFCVSIEQY
jgi:hypothetical protein